MESVYFAEVCYEEGVVFAGRAGCAVDALDAFVHDLLDETL